MSRSFNCTAFGADLYLVPHEIDRCQTFVLRGVKYMVDNFPLCPFVSGCSGCLEMILIRLTLSSFVLGAGAGCWCNRCLSALCFLSCVFAPCCPVSLLSSVPAVNVSFFVLFLALCVCLCWCVFGCAVESSRIFPKPCVCFLTLAFSTAFALCWCSFGCVSLLAQKLGNVSLSLWGELHRKA